VKFYYLYLDAGGSVVLLYASKHHDIKTVVNLSGRYDLKAGLEERLGKDYLERIMKDGFIDVMQSGNLSFIHTKVPCLLEHVVRDSLNNFSVH